ncbi:MAG TPA: hypothetical protein VMB21_14830 [Candidatus Limnocylindria bacterium]|nr:hypothetical protein [Candidatus Limnocylindria bacterium]
MKITFLQKLFARLAALFWAAFVVASPSTLAAKSMPLPSIYAFNVAAEATINLGQTTTLNWSVGDATEVTLTPDFGVVTGTSVEITPQVTTTYVLTAKNARGSVSKSKKITVIVPPVISSFTATPDSFVSGGSAKLTWSASGADWYQLTADVGASPGQLFTTNATIRPKTTTTYTLRANNAAGSSVKTLTVTVLPVGVKPTIASFTASPATVTAGGYTTLSWSVTNAAQLSISPSVGTVSGNSIVVTPAASTTYVLTATNPNGSVTRSFSVTVQPVLPPLPSIASFGASPATVVRGSSATLTWAVTGADGLAIAASTGASPGFVTGTSAVVTPLTDTVYTLTATNLAGSVTRTVPVAVTVPLPLPTISAFTASPTNVTAGSPTTLSWSVTGAAHISIAPGLGEVTGNSIAVMPTNTTTYVITAVNDTGSVSRSVAVTVDQGPSPVVNLFSDPQFETGVSDVFVQDDSSSVTRSADAPLLGASSLKVSIAGYGNNIWWIYDFNGGLASHFAVSARARSDVASASTLQFCAMVYYADGSTDIRSTPVSGAAGDKGRVSAEIDIDPAKRLQSVDFRLVQEGSAPVSFTFDDALALLDVIELPPGGGGNAGGGDNGGGSGGGSIGCPPVVPGTSAYPGFVYNLPTVRPYLSLLPYTQVNQSSVAFSRFRAAANDAVAGNPPYLYSAVSSVVMYQVTGNAVYINDAVARVERFVSEAETAIAAGNNPAIAGDSYLDIGGYIEELAFTYDYAFGRLTQSQRDRWAAFADQSIFNLWHPSEASWGGRSAPWSGWSICDPGNNYHFHFLRATMLWALATQNTDLITFLQAEKFPRLVDYYLDLPGGGSREGTGYGTALRDLFDDYITWKYSTGEDLSALTPHTRQTIDYWVHATVPTLDRFAPIGDQSRVSIPDLFDYQENLVHGAVALNPGTPEAQRGTWWLNHNSVNGVGYAFNLMGDLLPLPDAPVAPTDLMYHASGAGVLFARSSWATNASWLAFVAGKFDQSHAHEDQGSFTFFKRDWLSVTANIWSHSGLHEETDAHNTLRFERADGSIIPQNQDDTRASSMTPSIANGRVTVAADLSNAFTGHASLVSSWHRNLDYLGDTLRISDTYTVAAGVRAVFQVQVPVPPVLQADGSFIAGHLHIVPIQGVTATVHAMPAPEFSQGYRIDFVSTAGPTFVVELRAQ